MVYIYIYIFVDGKCGSMILAYGSVMSHGMSWFQFIPIQFIKSHDTILIPISWDKDIMIQPKYNVMVPFHPNSGIYHRYLTTKLPNVMKYQCHTIPWNINVTHDEISIGMNNWDGILPTNYQDHEISMLVGALNPSEKY